MTKTLFESNNALISYNDQEGFVRFTIKKFVKDEDFKDVLQKMLEVFPTLGASKVLNDFRQFKGVSSATQQWVVQSYYPTMVKNGLLQAALVLNNDIFAKLAGKNVKSGVEELFAYKAFPHIEEAEDWLMAKEMF